MEGEDAAGIRYEAGLAAFRRGDQSSAAAAFEESLRLARASTDDTAVMLAMMGLARVDLRRGDVAAVRRRATEALALAERVGPVARQHPLHLLAASDRVEGNYDRAERLYRESVELNRALGNIRWVAMETMNLAAAERGLGRLLDAEAHLREALSQSLEGAGDLIPFCVLGFAAIAAERGEATRAGTLIGALDAWLSAEGQALDPDDAPDYERAVARGREVGGEQFERGRLAGRSMSLARAARFALGGAAAD